MSIINLLKTKQADNTVITHFSVGSFVLDCQLEESHESNLTITENPLESGARVNDHASLAPKRYAVRGIMVSYEPFDIVDVVIGDDLDVIKSLPLPMGIIAKTEQAAAVVNRYVSKAVQIAERVQKAAQKLSPYLPDSLGWLGDEAPRVDRIAQAYDDLLSIQMSGELLTVTSGMKTYDNMMLESIVGNRGVEDGAEFALTFKEIHIVETQTVQGLIVNIPEQKKTAATNTSKVDGVKKTERAQEQSAKVASKGKTQPTQVQQPTVKKSVLKQLFG